MAPRQPRILVNNAAEPVAEFVIGALPQGAEGARGRDNRIIVDAVTGADLGDAVGHAAAAGDAIDKSTRAFETAMQHTLGGGHLPQHIHVDAALAVRALIGDAGLLDAAGDRVGDQLLMPLTAGAAEIDLRDQLALVVVAVGIDAGEGADPARGGPCPGALPVRDPDASVSPDDRPDPQPRHPQRL